MRPLNTAGSVATFLADVARVIGHDTEVFITATWASETHGSEAWMADLHVRVPQHDPEVRDAEHSLSDYAEAGGTVAPRVRGVLARPAPAPAAGSHADTIRRLDALTHAERRIRDAADRSEGYYELGEGLIPAGSQAAGLLARWDEHRARLRLLADEAGEALRVARQAVITWAIDAARGKGLLDGVALNPANTNEWNTYGFVRPLPILLATVARVEGQTTGDKIACYVALGYTEEEIGGRTIRTPDMHGMVEVYTYSAYMGVNDYMLRRLNDYRGGEVRRGQDG